MLRLSVFVLHGVALAGFGNSYRTDGPFLRYIATQPSLPDGIRATSVMINVGKARPGYTEHFTTFGENDVVGLLREEENE